MAKIYISDNGDGEVGINPGTMTIETNFDLDCFNKEELRKALRDFAFKNLDFDRYTKVEFEEEI